jgi:hypothetical protein
MHGFHELAAYKLRDEIMIRVYYNIAYVFTHVLLLYLTRLLLNFEIIFKFLIKEINCAVSKHFYITLSISD